MSYDTIIRNGRWFDGTGAPSAVRNLGIRDGHVVTITPHGREALASALASWGKVQAGLTHMMGADAADGLRRLATSSVANIRTEV